jgi:hypothetical protein
VTRGLSLALGAKRPWKVVRCATPSPTARRCGEPASPTRDEV